MTLKLLTLKVEPSEWESWKARAKESGITLSAWIRRQCMESDIELVAAGLTKESLELLRDKLPMMETTPRAAMIASAVNESNEQYYHTAASHRHTCLCPSCTNYRERNAIPLGGFTK